MKKGKFNIAIWDVQNRCTALKEVNGYIETLEIDNMHFYIGYYKDGKVWRDTELITGKQIYGYDSTIVSLELRVKNRIKEFGTERFMKLIDEQMLKGDKANVL